MLGTIAAQDRLPVTHSETLANVSPTLWKNVMFPLPLVSETKAIAAGIGLLAGIVVAWVVSHKKETMAGENAHQEIYRLRHDISSLHYLLVMANGFLCAILAALIF